MLFSDKKVQLVQADDRGRILLPRNLRDHKLFELEQEKDRISLYPLKTERLKSKKNDSDFDPYLSLENSVFPKLKNFCQSHAFLAMVMYGSYARGEAFNTSDLDLAVFLNRHPNFKKRTIYSEKIAETLQPEIKLWKQHGYLLEPSLVYVTVDSAQQEASLVFSIASDAVVIHEKKNAFMNWQKKVLKHMKEKGVLERGSGKKRIWHWDK